MPGLARSIAERLRRHGIAALIPVPVPADAHVQSPPLGPGDLWSSWSVDPSIVAALAGIAIAYGAGARRLWIQAGVGRGVAVWQVASFYAGMAVLAAALVSPLDGLGEALFSAHMAQHILLTAVVPPLLLLGRPLVLLWSLPVRFRRTAGIWLRLGVLPRIWCWMTKPVIAFLTEAAVLWGWHAPWAIHAALENDFVHALMHGSFLLGGLLLWETLAHPGRRGMAGYPIAAAASFLTMLHTGLLGALLTFAPRPFYTFYGDLPVGWGLTPLEDQQLAGLFMWVVCGMIYIVVALALTGVWLHNLEKQNALSPTGSPSATPRIGVGPNSPATAPTVAVTPERPLI